MIAIAMARWRLRMLNLLTGSELFKPAADFGEEFVDGSVLHCGAADFVELARLDAEDEPVC